METVVGWDLRGRPRGLGAKAQRSVSPGFCCHIVGIFFQMATRPLEGLECLGRGRGRQGKAMKNVPALHKCDKDAAGLKRVFCVAFYLGNRSCFSAGRAKGAARGGKAPTTAI